MKIFKQIIIILVVFIKTETLLSDNEIFNVNNIELEKNNKISNKSLADKAIKKGFNQLISKILLKDDIKILSNLDLASIKRLVTYYQITSIDNKEEKEEYVNFSVTFDKEKIHDLFYKKGISYSEISDKEFYILPILIKKNEIYVFNNNFFYEKWNEYFEDDLVEFNLLLEKIEIIQKINRNKNDLINLNINNLFKEYPIKNLAFVIIEDNKFEDEKVYLKTRIQGKDISKSITISRQNLDNNKFYQKIILETKKELINLVKLENLVDIRTPSFLNVKLDLSNQSNLVELNSRIKKIDLIDNIFVLDFNKDYMNLKIKYLGKLEKMINQLKNERINLQLVGDQWVIRVL